MDADRPLISVSNPSQGVTCLRLDRYARRNAMDRSMWLELRDRVAEARADSHCRVLVLTGTNDAFSAGADLRSSGSSGSGVTAPAARLDLAGRVLRELGELRKPSIAAVDGVAVGIGWSLALACDVVLASDSARFRCGFLQQGLVPDGGILWSLVHTVGTFRAAELLYSDRYLTAGEAAELGLVSRNTNDVPAIDAAVELASTLVAGSPDALELSALLLRAAASQTEDEYRRSEWVAAALNLHSDHAFSNADAFRD